MAEKREIQEFKIDWQFPDKMETHFVNNFIVQHQPGTFYISAHHILPPLPTELTGQAISDSVPAVGKVRLAMDQNTIERLMRALQTNLDTYKASMASDESFVKLSE